MVNMENLDSIQIDVNVDGYMVVKNLNYVKNDSADALYPIIDKINGYIKENKGNKCLTLVPTDEARTR